MLFLWGGAPEGGVFCFSHSGVVFLCRCVGSSGCLPLLGCGGLMGFGVFPVGGGWGGGGGGDAALFMVTSSFGCAGFFLVGLGGLFCPLGVLVFGGVLFSLGVALWWAGGRVAASLGLSCFGLVCEGSFMGLTSVWWGGPRVCP